MIDAEEYLSAYTGCIMLHQKNKINLSQLIKYFLLDHFVGPAKGLAGLLKHGHLRIPLFKLLGKHGS